MYRTVNNIKYTLFKLNKDTGYRLSGLSTFKHPVFFTFINKVNHDYGVYGQNIEINKISDGEYEINPYVLAEKKKIIPFNYTGYSEVSFGIDRYTTLIVFYGWIVWNHLPTTYEYLQLTLREKGTQNYITVIGDRYSEINKQFLQPLYLSYINVPDKYYDKDLVFEVKAINNGIFETRSDTKFFINTYILEEAILDSLEITILVIEGENNVEN